MMMTHPSMAARLITGQQPRNDETQQQRNRAQRCVREREKERRRTSLRAALLDALGLDPFKDLALVSIVGAGTVASALLSLCGGRRGRRHHNERKKRKEKDKLQNTTQHNKRRTDGSSGSKVNKESRRGGEGKRRWRRRTRRTKRS